jgi:hypothetical protein
MKPFARIANSPCEDRTPAPKPQPAQLERRWVKVDGRLECRYVMVRAG